ncbi:MAG: AbrB/MazE/SpoVT family DNA-binding domain-containing protein [Candidatus Bathyarchaeia archaeon]
MLDDVVLVTRKGQITIPVSKRNKYGIKEGMKVLVTDSSEGIIIKPITPIDGLAGMDAGKVSVARMRRKLDDMRAQDRY